MVDTNLAVDQNANDTVPPGQEGQEDTNLFEENNPESSVEENEETKNEVSDKKEAVDTVNDSNNAKDEEFEKIEWIKKRLKKQNDRHDKELREVRAQYELVVQNAIKNSALANNPHLYQQNVNAVQQQNNLSDIDPTSPEFVVKLAQDAAIKAYENAKILEQQKQKKDEDSRRIKDAIAKEKIAREKFDDYDDVIDDLQDFISKEMQMTVLDLSETDEQAFENFYKIAKEQPQTIKDISKLSPSKQRLALARLDASISLNKADQNIQPKIITPSKLKNNNVVTHDPLDMSYEEICAERLKKFQRK